MSQTTVGAGSTFHVFVKNDLEKPAFAVQVTPSTTVKELHTMVAAREQRPPDTFFLLGNSKTLSNGAQTLGELNMQNGTTVHMLFRMNGPESVLRTESTCDRQRRDHSVRSAAACLQ